jgi:hypothetical protein
MFRAQVHPFGGCPAKKIVSGNRPGLPILPAQVVERESTQFDRLKYFTFPPPSKPVIQLTFCFLFDKTSPEEPAKMRSEKEHTHPCAAPGRRPTKDKKCGAIAVSRRQPAPSFRENRSGDSSAARAILLQTPYRLVSLSLRGEESPVSRRISQRSHEEKAMHLTSLHYLFLIPVGLALAFLLWVLWSVSRQLGKGGTTPEKLQPMISIRVRDPYSLEMPPVPARRMQIAPTVVATSQPPRESSFSSSREFSYAPPPPVLGTRFTPASSSAGQAGRR